MFYSITGTNLVCLYLTVTHDFVCLQITKKGQVVNIHHQVNIVTIGLTSTNPALHLPDVMLLARPGEQQKNWKLGSQGSSLTSGVIGRSSVRCSWSTAPSSAYSWSMKTAPSQPVPSDTSFVKQSLTTKRHLELKGLFPLKLVKISIFHKEKRRLRVNLASGRNFYLQLYAHPDCEQKVFEQWVRLVQLLQEAADNRHSPAQELTEPRGPIIHPDSSGIHQQRSPDHSRTLEAFQRVKNNQERDVWECASWKKDAEKKKILSVLAEKSLWSGNGGAEKSQQGCASVNCTSPPHQGAENREMSDTCWTVSRSSHAQDNQPLPQETQKKQVVKRKEERRKNLKEGENPPAEHEEYSEEKTKAERVRLKDVADSTPKGFVSEEQRRAEIILWMKKAEEEEIKHQEQKKTKKKKIMTQP
ncbi:uncharacterized protein LOC144669528 [Cetorhinus maximus]